MGNNQMCCRNSSSPNLEIQQISFSQPILTAFSNFMIDHPTIRSIVEQKGRFHYEIQANNSRAAKRFKQFTTSEGTFISDRNYQSPTSSQKNNSISTKRTFDETSSDYQKQNGYGVMLYNNKHYYEGEWRDGQKYGQGLLACEDGTYYIGQWKNDLACGKGLYGSIRHNFNYNGEWEKGQKNGKGVQIYQDGSAYQGDFVRGQKNGKGKLFYSNGTEYQGQFSNNSIQGNGIFKGKNHVYQGEWKNGKMHGTGRSQWKNQKGITIARYIGEYREGIKQGFGQYTDSKGVTYKAIWTNGQINERGPIVTQKFRQFDNLN